MICPKCGSHNVFVNRVNSFDLRDKHHGCLWWLCVGWWWIPFKWIFLTLPALIVKIFVPKKQRIVTNQQTVCVCQNCGYSGKLNNFNQPSGGYTSINWTQENKMQDDLHFGWMAHHKDIVQQIDEELTVMRKMIYEANDTQEKYDAYKSYFDYLKVGKEYYYDIDINAGKYFDKYVCDSAETKQNIQKFIQLETELNK